MTEIARYEPNLEISGRLAQALKQRLDRRGIFAAVSGSIRLGYVVLVNDCDGKAARRIASNQQEVAL